jgi:hypothetical protein
VLYDLFFISYIYLSYVAHRIALHRIVLSFGFTFDYLSFSSLIDVYFNDKIYKKAYENYMRTKYADANE